jgi:hypothetical protein
MPASIVVSVVRGGVVEVTGAGVGGRVVAGTIVVATIAVVGGIIVVVVSVVIGRATTVVDPPTDARGWEPPGAVSLPMAKAAPPMASTANVAPTRRIVRLLMDLSDSLCWEWSGIGHLRTNGSAMRRLTRMNVTPPG